MWTEVFSGLGQRTEMVDTILKSSTHGLQYFLVKCCDLTNFPGKFRVTPLVAVKIWLDLMHWFKKKIIFCLSLFF